MKFNEKLIDLRKKAGLSQEELGEKLNVTRQTVSKWELGQTTPEMDKLSEMSKLFNVSVDGLVNEERENVEKKVEPNVIHTEPFKNTDNKKAKRTVIILLVILAVLVATAFGIDAMNKNKEKQNAVVEVEQADNFIERIFEMVMKIFDKTIDKMDEMDNIGNMNTTVDIYNQSSNLIDEINKNTGNILDKFGGMAFNSSLEMYGGTSSSIQVDKLLTEVNNNNKKNERKITVVFNEVELKDEAGLLDIQSKLSGNYLVSFDYDAEGYINKVTIKRVYTEMDKNKFNGTLELYQGVGMGNFCKAALNEVVSKNAKNEKKITVVYGKTTTQDASKINSITAKIDVFSNYSVTYEYDADGFINKVIIKKV